MRLILCSLFCIILIGISYADVVLYHFTDKSTGEERGIVYSDKDGNPSIINSNWSSEVIPENQKEHYINIHNIQIKQKQQQADNELKQKKNKARAKLASQGFTQDEIDGIVR